MTKMNFTPNISSKKEKLLTRICFVSLAIIAYLILWPNNLSFPKRDSGAFLYIGQQILKGLIPYKDLWDHKGPSVFYLNALGLFISSGKFFGVWLLQYTATTFAAFFSFKITKHYFGILIGFLASSVFLIMLININVGGNETEQWALIFQVIALYIFIKSKSEKKQIWRYFTIGVLGGITFLLRQNLIGIWLGIGLFYLVNLIVFEKNKKYKQLFTILISILAGAIAVISMPVIYFYSKGALSDYWNATFTFNFAYSDATLIKKIGSVIAGIKTLYFSSIAITIAICVLFNLKKIKNLTHYRLIAVASVTLLIEIFLSSLSGSSTPHYYIAWIPSTIVLFAFFLHLLKNILQPAISNYLNTKTIVITLTIIASLPLLNEHLESYLAIKNHKGKWFREYMIEYIEKNTNRNDYVLHWGMVGSVNFLTKRRSPTKYFYQYALNRDGFSNEKQFLEFLNEVKSKAPKIIVDASKDESLPPIDDDLRKQWLEKNKEKYKHRMLPKNSNLFFEYVKSCYVYVGNIGYMKFYVHK